MSRKAPHTRLALAAARATYRHSTAALPERLELPRLLNARGLHGRGAEVGVYRAEFTAHLLRGWHGRELVAVDPWRSFADAEYRDVLNAEQAVWDDHHEVALARLAPFGARAAVWRTTGDEAAARIQDGALDWVYLDAMHDRESVASDLLTWWPKVRPGGIVAGHDYLEGQRGETEFGVRPAVDGFFGARGLTVDATYLDEPFISWIVAVPGNDGAGERAAARRAAVAVRSALIGARRLTDRVRGRSR